MFLQSNTINTPYLLPQRTQRGKSTTKRYPQITKIKQIKKPVKHLYKCPKGRKCIARGINPWTRKHQQKITPKGWKKRSFPFALSGLTILLFICRRLHPVRYCVVVSSVTLEKLVSSHCVSCSISVI